MSIIRDFPDLYPSLSSCPHFNDNNVNPDKIQEFFQLNVSFNDQTTISLDEGEEELYTRRTFRELIEEKEKSLLPYFLALVEDAAGRVNKFDGIAFIRAYFKFDQHQLANNRLFIKKASFYKIHHLRDSVFQFFCTLDELKEDLKETTNLYHSKNFFAKYINACDLNLSAEKRGVERCYLIYKYQEGFTLRGVQIEPNAEEAKFWLERAIEDQTPLAYKQLAFFYALGKGGYSQSAEKARYYFQLAHEKEAALHS